VALLDIDYFKALNDSAGHLSGDECLRRVATALRKAAGEGFVARYGGEEFAILLEFSEEDEPVQRLEELRGAVLGLDIAHPGRPGELLTISIGGTMAVEAENSRVVLDRADTALYRAKAQGRNRVEFEAKWQPRAADTASLKRLLDAANHGRSHPALPGAQRDSA
jgi:diguanylate cyclase (GGDEF)-like protein